MKKILAASLVGAMLFSFTACSRFGPNDNPPMLISAVFGLKAA